MVKIVQPTQEILASSDGIKWAAYPDGDKPAGGTDLSQILFSDNFESGVLGNNAVAAVGTYDADHMKYAELNGSRVVSDIATAGTFEWANGFNWLFPSGVTATKGDQLWMRIKCLMPTGSDYTANGYGLKWMRFYAPEGHIDVYLEPDGDWRCTVEGQDPVGMEGGWDVFTTDQSHAPVFDVFETYEMSVTLDNVAKISGGEGLIQFWKNGILVGESDKFQTLDSATSECDASRVRTYWNGSVPSTQTWYWDDFAMACKIAGYRDDTPHLDQDADGNLYIGTGS